MTDSTRAVPIDDPTAERSETPESLPSGRASGAMIEKQDHHFEPSPLALLSEDDFERRLALLKKEISRMSRIRREVMIKGYHYGTIEGTEKPGLFQPGAQLLNSEYIAGYTATYEWQRILGDGETTPTITFVVMCRLHNPRTGYQVGEGLGVATSWERKHRYRYNDRSCPVCGCETIKRAKKDDTEQAYYCWKKIGGCGESFPPNSPSVADIESQPFMQENPDPHDLENTLIKMGAKRAHMGATVQAHSCSGEFAQDYDPDDPEINPQEQRDAESFQGRARRAMKGSRHDNSGANSSRDPGEMTDARIALARGKLRERFVAKGFSTADKNLQHAEGMLAEGIDEKAKSFADLKGVNIDDLLGRIGQFDG